MATGEVLGCFGLTEPDHGSNPADLRATAEALPGGGWRISGRKVFITNGSIARLALVMARTGGPGAGGVSAFLVPTDRPGFGATRCTASSVCAPATPPSWCSTPSRSARRRCSGDEGEGLKVALSALDDGRMSIAASCTGIAHSALEIMMAYAGARAVRQADRRAPARAGADRRLGRRRRRLAAADVGGRGPQGPGQRYSLAASKAKLFATEASMRVANACIQVHGGYGYVDEFPAAKLTCATRGSRRCTRAPARCRSC